MVCYNEDSAQCAIFNHMPGASQKKIVLKVRPHTTVSQLYNDIRNQMDAGNFEICVETGKESEEVTIRESEDKTLSEIGINFAPSTQSPKNSIVMKLVPQYSPNSLSQRRPAIVGTCEADSTVPNTLDDDELALGASASPVEPTSSPIPLPLFSEEPTSTTSSRSSSGYVGLVNQAMTCYLNSLLQALYMTPEFRNALYNWEWDGTDATKNIPYQLQRLFLNLQTSTKLSVETTDLTRSFGWDSSEAWQQHDIQELCRVMFDTLEQNFKGTEEADFINRLYEGKMIDYVKCLECNTDKTREDKFLDIPLPVRPIGSKAYGSVEEALRAFVEPETLDGNNQYFCEKCNKKCDAHKGLKFSKFPYILTLHLKRFDFDYQTFHRIKLNDKVTFPQTLNLNSFIKESETNLFAQTNGTSVSCDTTSSEHGSVESAIKCDDCSTTDSGSILEEEVGNASSLHSMNHKSDLDAQDDDEGIDMSTSNENKSILANEPGPYNYELFSIMIHSGSASGGHYYAYIKEFENGEWFCFNDQNVSSITHEDIEKSYGGSLSTRSFYSSAYSSSTNAYMLMYRQIDPRRNVAAMKRDNFPEHIKKLQLTLKEESERKMRTSDYDLQKYKVWWFDHRIQQLVSIRIHLESEATLKEALEMTYRRYKLQSLIPMIPIERCRLVAYDKNAEDILQSFENKDDAFVRELLTDYPLADLLLEIRNEDSDFEVYAPGDIETKVYTVDTSTSDIDGPAVIRVQKTLLVGQYKKLLASKLALNAEDIMVAVLTNENSACLLELDNCSLAEKDVIHKSKIFVDNKNTDSKKFLQIVERSHHIISLYFTLPKTDKETLRMLSIPSYDPTANRISPSAQNQATNNLSLLRRYVDNADVVDAVMNSPPLSQYGMQEYRNTAAAPNAMEPESNSEDSSLSDGDRTLVGDVSPMLSTTNSPAYSDQQLSSPEEHFRMNGDCYGGDDDADMLDVGQTKNYYFKASYYEEPGTGDSDEPTRMLKVLVHRNLIIANLKRALEAYVKVPMEHFKIFRMDKTQEIEYTNLNEDLTSFKDGERLTIELGRALRKGEYKYKVYYLSLVDTVDEIEKITFLCDWILCQGANVGKTKREILAQIVNINPKYNIPYDRCRLRYKKHGRWPGKIYHDDQKFGDDIMLLQNGGIILQELRDSSEQVTDPDSVTVLVRRWNPSQMTLDPFDEITIDPKSEFKSLISKKSGIPVENIEFAKYFGILPHENVGLVDIQSSLNWNGNEMTLNDAPLNTAQDGWVYYYRDKTEELKKLTPAERQELKNQEYAQNSSNSDAFTFSRFSQRRRERALKIYVDSSPKKYDD